ncbi:hypothetical protein Taro_047898 [Colocasia esculenta]|uniref:Uncharacterized protein n=1 Tax=Colocasia esculenta TaxID=4460 RepID=A0A843WWN8_COLES|nr:hypothetical protein [Colocasia esculenta]
MWEMFHKLRMDYGTYSAVAASLRFACLVSLETQDVGDMWEIFHKLRMDYDTYSVVAAPLRFVCLVSLETPDVGDVPQTENELRHLFHICCSFEINFICIPGDPKCEKCSTN